jgi:hypothetical protein
MQLPTYAHPVFRSNEDSAVAILLSDEGIIQPAANYVCCLAACSSRQGYGACLARCAATGDVCDGGVNNCANGACN